MNIAQIQQGLGPVARAIIGGSVAAVTAPLAGKGHWTVALDTPGGVLPILVPAGHKIYARVAERAHRGDFWVVEADLALARGRPEIRVRHLLSSRDTFLPRITPANGQPVEQSVMPPSPEIPEAAEAGHDWSHGPAHGADCPACQAGQIALSF